jgi:hypothetical protein
LMRLAFAGVLHVPLTFNSQPFLRPRFADSPGYANVLRL